MNALRLAIFCFDNPFLLPPEGGKKAIKCKLLSLMEMNNLLTVDVYVMNKRTEGFANNYTGFENSGFQFYQYKMNTVVNSLFGMYPLCVNKRYSKLCVEELKEHAYDITIFEGLQVAKYLYEEKVKSKVNILYFHDIESVYRWQLAKSSQSLLKKIGNYLESYKFSVMERTICNYFDELWFISKDECENISHKINNKIPCIYLPFPALSVKNTCFGTSSNKMLYVGDLGLNSNLLSVIWFLDNVFPIILESRPDVEFSIVGKISQSDREKLQRKNVQVKGFVDDLENEYDSACLVVNPMLYGAGVKVKTIDALSYGQIVITNSKGIEGTEIKNNDHLIVEDNPVIMANKCLDVLGNREKYYDLQRRALAFIRDNHTINNQTKIMRDRIFGSQK